MEMKVAVAFCLVFVACVSADFSIDVPEEDRTFCQISTRLACTNACSGKGCTELYLKVRNPLPPIHLHLQYCCCNNLYCSYNSRFRWISFSCFRTLHCVRENLCI